MGPGSCILIKEEPFTKLGLPTVKSPQFFHFHHCFEHLFMLPYIIKAKQIFILPSLSDRLKNIMFENYFKLWKNDKLSYSFQTLFESTFSALFVDNNGEIIWSLELKLYTIKVKVHVTISSVIF